MFVPLPQVVVLYIPYKKMYFILIYLTEHILQKSKVLEWVVKEVDVGIDKKFTELRSRGNERKPS